MYAFVLLAGAALAEMVAIPAGSFTMGDTFSEGNADELPAHSVNISAFSIDAKPVTKELWDEVYLWSTSHGYSIGGSIAGKGPNHPVYLVNWCDAVKWCNARSEKEGLTPCYYTNEKQTTAYKTGSIIMQPEWVNWTTNGYRLPTEAEWEKAARGGALARRFPWNNADTISHAQANYRGAGSNAYDISSTNGYHPAYAAGGVPYTSPAGSFAANGYGLYDMAGNVSEWCWDWYDSGWYTNAAATKTDTRGPATGTARVVRGGDWYSGASRCRVADRFNYAPIYDVNGLGFRCVRSR
jgi:formylglycine-generating enzyme required for sulfatase activity